jgi:hypothetical protein
MPSVLAPSPWPVGAETYATRAIFMNHATGAVAPLDQEMVQVGHSIWQRAERRCLIQGPVRPVVVVEVLVLAQDGHQVPLIPDKGPVQQLSAQLPIHWYMIEFIRGAWTAERITRRS